MSFVDVSIWCALGVALFWLVAWLFWASHFSTILEDTETPAQRDHREMREERLLRRDLEGRDARQGVNIILLKTESRKDWKLDRETLLNLGVAENRTANREADRDVFLGNHWLCDRRPLWFAALQWLFASLVGYWLVSIGIETPTAAVTSLLIVTLLIALLSWTVVPENHRLGVKRFGRQCPGSLGSGLQFVVLIALGIIEIGELVPLTYMVWGPASKDVPDSKSKEGTAPKAVLENKPKETPSTKGK